MPLPKPVTAYGKQVNTTKQLDDVMAANRHRISRGQWNMYGDPNYQTFNKRLIGSLHSEDARKRFWSAAGDPVWQMMVRPLFKPGVTRAEIADVVDRLIKLKIVPSTGTFEPDYFHFTDEPGTTPK